MEAEGLQSQGLAREEGTGWDWQGGEANAFSLEEWHIEASKDGMKTLTSES